MALASLDDVQALEAAFATVDSLDTSDVMEAAPRKQWLSGAVKGMLLLNLSAALFGSNQAGTSSCIGLAMLHLYAYSSFCRTHASMYANSPDQLDTACMCFT